MTSALDTNVLVALLKKDDALNKVALALLDSVSRAGKMVICGPVAAELLALPGMGQGLLVRFLSDTRIDVEWDFDEPLWMSAGTAFARYAARRRKNKSGDPQRILADFLIGAHAAVNGYRLVTLDEKLYSAAFPQLQLISGG